MPRQNRSAPDGSLIAVAARGTLMGNRGGGLHRPDGTLGPARWRSKAWICCLLEFKDRRRAVMGPGYTEIFFLDEPTALAAGHRPCFECRRAEAQAFAAAWGRARGTPPPSAPEMDAALHGERLGPRKDCAARDLPPGAIFRHAGRFHLRTDAASRGWSFEGYGPEMPLPDKPVIPVTPASILGALRAGYAPRAHGLRS